MDFFPYDMDTSDLIFTHTSYIHKAVSIEHNFLYLLYFFNAFKHHLYLCCSCKKRKKQRWVNKMRAFFPKFYCFPVFDYRWQDIRIEIVIVVVNFVRWHRWMRQWTNQSSNSFTLAFVQSIWFSSERDSFACYACKT